MMKKNPLRLVWLLIGLICLALGTVGIMVPVLPTTPFYIGAVFCFTKSSRRIHDWFVGTDLYKKHVESYVENRAMTMQSKLKIMATVTLVMGIGFVMMKQVPIGRICLAVVWLGHILYFFFKIETI